MAAYDKKGGYAGYNANAKDRAEYDYYATPPKEGLNILEQLHIPHIKEALILEPCCGGGHLIDGIQEYGITNIIGTDIVDRGYNNDNAQIYYGDLYNFLSNDYPFNNVDYVIMNPPFKYVEGFVSHALEIAKRGVIMFGRLQFLEGQGRYKNIFAENPPTETYVYINRVGCYKNGDFSKSPGSVQAHAWYYWDTMNITDPPRLFWMWSWDHKSQL